MKLSINQEELEFFINKGFSNRELSIHFGMSISSIKRFMSNFGFKSKINQTKKQNLLCLECNVEFISHRKDCRKFCSSSCSAKYNNVRKEKKLKLNTLVEKKNRVQNRKPKRVGVCKNCDQIIVKSDGRSLNRTKFCNQSCSNEFRLKSRMENNPSIKTIKTYLRKLYGNKCMECGWCKVNPISGKVPIEIEHIDGNSENNDLSNLKLLCPNCHSLTPTYKSLNRGRGRHSRMVRYLENKSY